MAVVRFVNGMVDPLQTGKLAAQYRARAGILTAREGPYARPIAHIAASLGIPPSLISLRHRATHEDLPPLHTLQQAVRMAIQYIHDYSFLPLVAEPSQEASSSRLNGGSRGGDQAIKLVKRWKKAMKSRLRDKEVDEETPSGREIRAIKRDIESVDTRGVVEALVGEGGLVPLTPSKRPSSSERSPGTAAIQIWTPLLLHLAESHPDMLDLLSLRILDQLITTAPRPPGNGDMDGDSIRSYHWVLATWILHFWTLHNGFGISEESRKSLWAQLLRALIRNDEVCVPL